MQLLNDVTIICTSLCFVLPRYLEIGDWPYSEVVSSSYWSSCAPETLRPWSVVNFLCSYLADEHWAVCSVAADVSQGCSLSLSPFYNLSTQVVRWCTRCYSLPNSLPCSYRITCTMYLFKPYWQWYISRNICWPSCSIFTVCKYLAVVPNYMA